MNLGSDDYFGTRVLGILRKLKCDGDKFDVGMHGGDLLNSFARLKGRGRRDVCAMEVIAAGGRETERNAVKQVKRRSMHSSIWSGKRRWLGIYK